MADIEERVKPPGPHQDLFIYLIKGRVSEEDEARFGDAFLGNWVEDESSFLFFSAPAMEKVVDLVGEREDLEFFEDHHFTYEEWQGGVLDPLRIENFLIVPPWNRMEPGESETRIILDPGVVFGSGLHPTTSDSLKALAYLERRGPLGRVQDLGTGTGILALASALLGAERVVAVDLNPLSVKTAQKNVRLNGLEDRICVLAGDVRGFASDAADLVLANIHQEVLKDLFDNPSFREKKWFIVSGLMRSQARELKRQLDEYDFGVLREWESEGTWHTLLASSDKSDVASERRGWPRDSFTPVVAKKHLNGYVIIRGPEKHRIRQGLELEMRLSFHVRDIGHRFETGDPFMGGDSERRTDPFDISASGFPG